MHIYVWCVLSWFSCIRLFTTPWTLTHQAPLSMDFPGKNIGVGCPFLLQGIFPTQGWNPGLLHCQEDSLPGELPGKLSLTEYWRFFLFPFFFFKFYFIFKLYNIVLVLPNIKMNLPQVYMCSPSWTLLPPPSPYHPSGSSWFFSWFWFLSI